MSSMTPQRTPRSKDSTSPNPVSNSHNSPNGSTNPTKPITRRNPPLQPTAMEILLISIYPITLIIGSTFALLDSRTRNAPYDISSQSHYPATAPSYFAQKTNLFNILFVKRGWLWITISYFTFLFTHPFTGPASSPTLTPRRIQGLLRWTVVTAWWILTTQWFFGPALIDRSFLLTGGHCDLPSPADPNLSPIPPPALLLSSTSCKAAKGKWKGGHDVSGHVFLLVLGSLFLLGEVFHVLLRSSRQPEERTIQMHDGAIKSAEIESHDGNFAEVEAGKRLNVGVQSVLAVAALSLWMLLMTAVYFHTWFEKLTGLLIALMGVFIVHFLPRAIPGLRGVLGLPGV